MLNYQRVSWKLFRWLSKIEKFHHVSWFVHLHKVVLRCDFHSKNFPRFVCWVCCITQIFFRWWFFAKFEFFWTVSGSIIDGCKDLKGVFFTLYFIHHSIDTVQVQHSWFFLRTHWQERLHQPQQPRVLGVGSIRKENVRSKIARLWICTDHSVIFSKAPGFGNMVPHCMNIPLES